MGAKARGKEGGGGSGNRGRENKPSDRCCKAASRISYAELIYNRYGYHSARKCKDRQ